MIKRRLEMGEEAWAKYQRQRKNNKSDAWRSRNAERVVDFRRNTKIKLIDYKGGKCQVCGYDKDCPNAYDFHHRDPKTKSFGIGGASIKKFDKLKIEADKCDLLCRRCHAEIHDREYIKQRDESKEKLKSCVEIKRQKNSERIVEFRRNAKRKLIAYKGGKCQVCGYDKDCPNAYDFHHRDPKTKSFIISGSTKSFDQLKRESDKCDLICRRCHAELHDEENKKKREESKEKLKSCYVEIKKRKTWQHEKNCLSCQQFFIPKKKKQIYCCRNCANATRNKIN
jgi:hypothetical protein